MAPKHSIKALAREWHGSRLVQQWGGKEHSDSASATTSQWLQDVLSKTFLPEGYPQSVSSDYLGFQVWDTVQAISSYVRSMLSSQAVMIGIGVGKQAATAYGAVFLFAVRDLTGMLGGLVFAHMEGSGFDSCAKQWRLFADTMNDIAMAMDLASPLFPKSFLIMTCFGSLFRAMTGVAGGATRAALTQHFAKERNAADIAAKEQSQETMVTAIGMVLGMLLTRSCSDSTLASWLWFVVLTVLHVWANVRAMRCLVLTSVNQPRLDALLQAYADTGSILTPAEMAAAEDLTPPPFKRLLSLLGLRWLSSGARKIPPSVQLGVSLARAAAVVTVTPAAAAAGSTRALKEQQQTAAVRKLLKDQGHNRYLVVGTHRSGVLVVLHKEAGTEDVLRAYMQAWKTSTAKRGVCDTGQVIGEAWVKEHFDLLLTKLQGAGWHMDRVVLPRGGWMAEWQVETHKD